MPAAKLTTRCSGVTLARDLLEQRLHVLRLHHQHEGLGAPDRLGFEIVAETP